MALTIERHRHQKQEMKNAYFEVENEASAIRMFETIDVLISIFIKHIHLGKLSNHRSYMISMCRVYNRYEDCTTDSSCYLAVSCRKRFFS